MYFAQFWTENRFPLFMELLFWNCSWRRQMAKKTPIGNHDSLQRTRNQRAPAESLNLRETGHHVARHFPDTKREPELELPFELPPKKPGGNRS
ncbi:MAG: hypothetical protein L0I29_16520 [Hyphomicrobiales bacterium]|nr:hypothetical protein [Hyphomicrobiales bacterium]